MHPVFLEGGTHALSSECLTMRDTFLSENECADLACKYF